VPDEDSAVDFYRLAKERVRQDVGERRGSPMQASDRPMRTIADPDYSFASLLSFLESHDVADSEPASYADFLPRSLRVRGWRLGAVRTERRFGGRSFAEALSGAGAHGGYEADAEQPTPLTNLISTDVLSFSVRLRRLASAPAGTSG
jgi:hypothetical protein